MPSLHAILRRSLMFASTGQPQLRAAGDGVFAPPPAPGDPSASKDVLQKTSVWTWSHSPDRPHQLRNVGSRVRGMDMNYGMVMPVLDELSLDEVSLTTKNGIHVLLPLDKQFVVRKAFLHSGHVPEAKSGLWQLEAELDQSILVAFGYVVYSDGAVNVLPAADIEVLADTLIPHEGTRPSLTVSVDKRTSVLVAPLRVLVVFNVTCCKERPDFEPGGVLGANRIYPHVMVTCSDEIKSVGATVTIKRPAKAAHSGPMRSHAQYPDHMLSDIEPLLVADANALYPTFPGAPILPFWDRMFDYYDTEPLKSGTAARPIVVVDPARNKRRVLRGALMKVTPVAPPAPATHHPVDLVKLPGQGAFDNIHLAPRMRMAPKAFVGQGLHVEEISMAPFCIHDCLHTHFRWGLAQPQKWTCGFDANYNPYSVAGAPLVPHDQKVTITFASPSSYVYDARVSASIPAGRTTVFFHHGMAYANEIWEPGLTLAAQATIDVMALGRGEHRFPGTLTSTDSWAVFYWRLRYGGRQNVPIERIQVPDLAAAMAL